MRLFVLVAFLFCFLIHPLHGQNLNIEISEDYSGKNLNEVLKSIQNNHDLKFAFDERRLAEIQVEIDKSPWTVKEFLITNLSPNQLSYIILDNTIIIKPKEEIPEELRPILTPKFYTLSGFIFDRNSGERLPYAAVSVKPTNKNTSTNLNGFFSMKGLSSDSILLDIYYIGYKPISLSMTREEASNIQRIGMSANNSILDEVLVEANTNTLIEMDDEISKVSINPAQMQNLPNLGEVDIFRSIQLLPGITGTFETASSINIRGSGPDHNLILYDGFNIYHLDHFFGIFSAFNNNSIKNIKVYKGGFDARYGGRVGGVLDITGKTGNAKKPKAGLGINFIGFNTLFELPIKEKTTIFFSARRSMTDFAPAQSYKDLIVNVLNNDVNAGISSQRKNFEELDPIFNFYDINAKVSHRFSDEEILSFSFYHGRDLFRIDNSDDLGNLNFSTENRTRWGNIGVGTNYFRQWEKNFYSNLTLGVSNYFSRVTDGASKEFRDQNENLDELILYEQKNDVQDVTLKIDNGWNYATDNTLEFGMASTSNIISYSVFEDSIFTEESSESATQSAIYAQNRFRFKDKLELVPGIRLNYYDLTHEVFFEPRFNFSYKLFDRLKLKGAFGRYSQFVSRVLRKDVFASNPDFWVLSNGDNIPVLKSQHLIGGFNFQISRRWSFDVEAYKKWDNGVLEYIPPEGIFANSAPADFPRYFRGSGISKGIEFLLQKKGKSISGWISYALSYSENKFEQLNDNEKYPSNQDQRHEVKFVSIFTVKNFEFSAIWIYGSGRPYTEPLGQFTIDNPGDGELQILYVSDINSARLPEYHRLDLSMKYGMKIRKTELDMGFSIFNVYDRNNVRSRRFLALDRDLDSDEDFIGNTNYVQRDLNLLGFSPNLSLQVLF